MSYRDYEKNVWVPVSWNRFSEVVRKVSASLLALGVDVQENLAVFSQNMPECLYVDFGAYGVRAVTIPFYATSSESQVVYMVNDAEIRMCLSANNTNTISLSVACLIVRRFRNCYFRFFRGKEPAGHGVGLF